MATPRIQGLGILGDALNFIGASVAPRVLQMAMLLGLAYYGWEYYAKAQELTADIDGKAAEAASADAEADALNARIKGVRAQTAATLAELDKLQAEAELAGLEARANASRIGEGSARLAALVAEMQKARADADKADAEQKAQNQLVEGGIRLAVAQRRAEIAVTEGGIKDDIQGLCMVMHGTKSFTEDGLPTVDIDLFSPDPDPGLKCPGLD